MVKPYAVLIYHPEGFLESLLEAAPNGHHFPWKVS